MSRQEGPRRRRDAAFAFEGDRDLDALRQRLNARGTHDWIERDSHWYGDYISALAHEDYGFYKIYVDEEAGGYVFTIKFIAERPTFDREYAELERVALEEILPWIGARDVRERELWD